MLLMAWLTLSCLSREHGCLVSQVRLCCIAQHLHQFHWVLLCKCQMMIGQSWKKQDLYSSISQKTAISDDKMAFWDQPWGEQPNDQKWMSLHVHPWLCPKYLHGDSLQEQECGHVHTLGLLHAAPSLPLIQCREGVQQVVCDNFSSECSSQP